MKDQTQQVVGKTVASVVRHVDSHGEPSGFTMTFTDGTVMTVGATAYPDMSAQVEVEVE